MGKKPKDILMHKEIPLAINGTQVTHGMRSVLVCTGHARTPAATKLTEKGENVKLQKCYIGIVSFKKK